MLTRVRAWWRFRRAVAKASQGNFTCRPGKKDIVVLPCWRRPEFLWHCLDNLVRTESFDGVHLHFRPDTGFSPDNLDVIHSFAPRLTSFEIILPEVCPFRRTKQSANLLLGYLRAAAATKQYVFLVEEDTMVSRDFLRWHRAVHAAGDPLFCSIAVKNHNRKLTVPDEPEGYYLSSGDYCSYGVCFHKHVLQTVVAPHVNLAYFRRPKNYVRRHFPSSAVGLGFVEQDGLLRRIQEFSNHSIAYPCVPRAFDAGFYGYNRPGGIGGTTQDRIQGLSNTIYKADAMREVTAPEYIGRCMPIDLEPAHWEFQRRIDVPMTSS